MALLSRASSGYNGGTERKRKKMFGFKAPKPNATVECHSCGKKFRIVEKDDVAVAKRADSVLVTHIKNAHPGKALNAKVNHAQPDGNYHWTQTTEANNMMGATEDCTIALWEMTEMEKVS